MKTNKTLRSWTDPAFRATLSASERNALQMNPAGEPALDAVVGGMNDAVKDLIALGPVVTRDGNYGTADQGLCAPEGWDCGRPRPKI